ncbi:J domain-containing protein [Patescibacteria group bacterium]|nr:J domain-containing protein [Patescibacteria group bacterium]
MEQKAYPLCWPDGWPRTPYYKRGFGRFLTDKRNVSVNEAVGRVLAELKVFGIPDWKVIISTNIKTRLDGLPYSNQGKPDDPGVAVYWQSKKDVQRCIAIDRYTDVAQNLAAVAATLNAMRAIERHGGAEILDRAFTGFVALPAPEQWWQVLGFESSRVTRDQIEQAYRSLAMQHHPDRSGDSDAMARINVARDEGLRVAP